MVDVWSTIHDERRALAADLDGLSDEQWNTVSFCSDWTVREVLAHMTATAKMSAGKFFVRLAGSGFSFSKVQTRGIAGESGGSGAEALGRFKAVEGSSGHPPGPNDSWLGETIVHAEDIRRPLGIEHSYPRAAAAQLGEFYRGSNLLIGAKKRVNGLKLRATDFDWTVGDGPEVAGPVVSLVMAMTGRKQVIDDLQGDGVGVLRSRP